MLSLVMEPVYFSSVTVGGQCPYSAEAMRRAVVGRLKTSADTPCPALLRSVLGFEHAKRDGDACAKPCPSSVIWWKGEPGYRYVQRFTIKFFLIV